MTFSPDIWDLILKEMQEVEEKRLFAQLKIDGKLVEAVLVANPKHKQAFKDYFDKTGTKIPILWHRYVEEDKCYMVWDKDMIENIRRMNGE